eukprot:70908_1
MNQQLEQENAFIQFSHHLFNGTHYCIDGNIPENVVSGIADAFHRYGSHLAQVIQYHRNMDSDYFYLYLSQFLNVMECQEKLNQKCIIYERKAQHFRQYLEQTNPRMVFRY